ncbi:MAG: SDR family oxidoreductase [Bacteroidales bacterium]|nr:SDR family oxidoreductase [Bacteroidales bacterium]
MLNHKTALITGGSRGIGAVVAENLGRNGYYVYLNCRKTNNNIQQVLNTILSEGGNGEIIEFDVANKNSIEQAIGNAKVERIDLLLNNAGILFDNLICNLELEQWESIINTNFWGSYNVMECVFGKLMNSPSPVVINMGSTSGVKPRKGQGAYSVSKAMIIEWTAHLTTQEQYKKIHAFCISPGPVETEMIMSSPWYADPKSKKRIPLGRYAKPQEISNLIHFLAEEPKVFKNGFNFIIDGGFTQTVKDLE